MKFTRINMNELTGDVLHLLIGLGLFLVGLWLS